MVVVRAITTIRVLRRPGNCANNAAQSSLVARHSESPTAPLHSARWRHSSLAEAAERSGVSVEELRRLVRPRDPDARRGRPLHRPSMLRRAALVKGLADAGIPLDGLGAAIRSGKVSLDFLDAPAFERFSALGGDTFAETGRADRRADRAAHVRPRSGRLRRPAPDDRVRDDEAPYVELVETALAGWHPPERDRAADPRAGRRMRRIAETRVVDVADRGDRAGHRSAACGPTRSSEPTSATG